MPTVERLATFCRSPLASAKKSSPRLSNGSSNWSASGWWGAASARKSSPRISNGSSKWSVSGWWGAKERDEGACQDEVDSASRDGASPDLDPLPMLRHTATAPPAVELQEVLVQPSRKLDTGEHHKAYLDGFRPAAVEVQPLQLDEPAQKSELTTPKPNESREATPCVDLPTQSNNNGSLVEEAMAAGPPVRKRQAWRRSSTLVEDSTQKMTRPPPSAQNRLQALSRRAPGSRNFPFSFSPSVVRERSVSAPPGLRRTPSEIIANSFSSNSNPGLAAVKREMNKNEQELLNKSNMWRLKTYYVFPLLSQLRHADHPSRIIFPAAYIIFVLVMLSEVNFGVQEALGHQLRCDSAGS